MRSTVSLLHACSLGVWGFSRRCSKEELHFRVVGGREKERGAWLPISLIFLVGEVLPHGKLTPHIPGFSVAAWESRHHATQYVVLTKAKSGRAPAHGSSDH